MFLAAIKNYQSKFDFFLFGLKHSERLGFFRIFLGGTLTWIALARQLNMDQYTTGSIIPRTEALNVYPEFYRPLFEYFFWPDSWAPTIHIIYILLLVFLTLGLSNRFLMLITWILAQGFINRNYSMLFGADLIGTLFLFYLCWTLCCEKASLKNIFFKCKNVENIHATKFSEYVSSVFFRLLQVQICVIYAYTGFEKLKGNSWWDGTALWTVFANPQFTNFNLLFLKNFPLVFAFGTFTSIIFEIYFPVMVYFKKTRYLWLSVGVVFHLSIGILLGLMPFSLIMLSTYFLFLDRSILIHLLRQILDHPVFARLR